MRMSQLFSQTLRDAPGDAEVTSHKLLTRAGFIRQLAAGVFSTLPLGQRSVDKIAAIIREEIDRIGGQELTMPVVHPAEIWKETGRWYQIDAEMSRFKDRRDSEMVLAMTHEEVVTDLARREISSYRQLPRLVYQIQTKWRDDPRPRAGLIRVREFSMKDSYSLDADWEGLDLQYRKHYQAYFNIFARCGLPVIAVKSDVGMMGGSEAHEFMYLTPIGEDTLVLCDACGYAANRQNARFVKPEAAAEELQPIEKVETPGAETIEDLAKFLDIPKSKTAKAVFYVATVTEGKEELEKFVFAIVRGDMELNETKLANAVGAKALRPAREEEIRAVGAVPGYGSPVGLTEKVLIIVDDAVKDSFNLVAGANEAGYHARNVNCGRDYEPDVVTDLAAAQAGDACPECGKTLRTSRGVEVGNIFKLGTRYSEAMGATYLDKNGEGKPIIMGSYGIGLGRVLACVAEAFNDKDGLMWPVSVAPYQVHLVGIFPEDEDLKAEAMKLYEELQAAGLEVLVDDRDERPGVKFKDADLIGAPVRLTLGGRSLEAGGVEFKRRDADEKEIVARDQVVARAKAEVDGLFKALEQQVVPVPYDD